MTGALVGELVKELQTQLASTSGSVADLLSSLGASPRYASCGTAVLIVPEGYHVRDMKENARNLNDPTPTFPQCTIEQPPYLRCPIPDTAFANTQAGNVFIATFINWAQEARHVRIIIEFDRN
jgi:hypothetical protein